jgi:predicted transcriptional regulator
MNDILNQELLTTEPETPASVPESTPEIENQMLTLTANIVAAHVQKNEVPLEELPDVIEKVYTALASVYEMITRNSVATPKLTPAVSIKKSVTPDYIICLEDGKKLKMLKRHLKAVYDMSVHEYKERWGLPADYPMVAPNYAKKRSRLAKNIGLGTVRTRKETTAA